jgi:uncharacterized protein
VGRPDAEGTILLHAQAARGYRPFNVVVPVEPGPRQEAIARILSFVGAMTPRDNQATAYVCRDFTCRQPVTTADALASQL